MVIGHLFTSGPSGALLPDYATRWSKYLAQMKTAGALTHVAYWYPSDEPDLRMPVGSLNKILAAIKSQSPGIPILLTLSNLAFNETTGVTSQAIIKKSAIALSVMKDCLCMFSSP